MRTLQLVMSRGLKDYYHQNGGNGKCLTISTS
uniref:ZDS n=1 Tax=Arundo donax TaxID=35708 RepID=A0A0A9DNA1_ARUDO